MNDPRRNGPQRPLPLSDVLAIVEHRRRRRARMQRAAAPLAGIATAGVVAAVVVAVQIGSAPAPVLVTPAAPVQVPARPPRPAQPAAPRSAPPFDPGYLRSDYLTTLADSILTGGSDPADVRKVDDAYQLADAWGLQLYPAAKAVAAKAALTGTAIRPTDPRGDDELVGRFERAGYRDDYAKTLAKAWSTDVHTAKVMGALVLDAGCCTPS